MKQPAVIAMKQFVKIKSKYVIKSNENKKALLKVSIHRKTEKLVKISLNFV